MSKQTEALKMALGIARSMFAADDAYGCGYYNNPSWRAAYRELRKITQEALAHAPTEQEQPAQQDIPKIGCVNHDCDKCKAQQQEPVAWIFTDKEGTEFFEQREDWEGRWTPLYTSPPASKPWVGLTDEERLEVAEIDGAARQWFLEICKELEAKLKEKNI